MAQSTKGQTMAKRSQPAAANNRTLNVKVEADEDKDKRIAKVAVDPKIAAAATIQPFAKGNFGELGFTHLADAIDDKVAAVRRGDMSGVEAVLVAQSASLDAIFAELARRSALNMGQYIEASERYMRLALKAQAQCRATLEALSAIKNPPIVYARQANISAGPQQVNNGVAAPSRTGESDGLQNELMEVSHDGGQRLESGTTRAAARSDTEMATVGDVHRPPHS